MHSCTPDLDTGSTCAQIFVGTKTFITHVYGMKTYKKFVKNLEDNIMERKAMDKIILDSDQY